MSNRVVVKLCDQCEEHWVPRAVVALSDDRQWLVVLMPDEFFEVFQFEDSRWDYGYIPKDRLKDTGQSAEDALRVFMRQELADHREKNA